MTIALFFIRNKSRDMVFLGVVFHSLSRIQLSYFLGQCKQRTRTSFRLFSGSSLQNLFNVVFSRLIYIHCLYILLVEFILYTFVIPVH